MPQEFNDQQDDRIEPKKKALENDYYARVLHEMALAMKGQRKAEGPINAAEAIGRVDAENAFERWRAVGIDPIQQPAQADDGIPQNIGPGLYGQIVNRKKVKFIGEKDIHGLNIAAGIHINLDENGFIGDAPKIDPANNMQNNIMAIPANIDAFQHKEGVVCESREQFLAIAELVEKLYPISNNMYNAKVLGLVYNRGVHFQPVGEENVDIRHTAQSFLEKCFGIKFPPNYEW